MRLSPINLKILAYTLDVEGFDSSGVLRPCGLASADALDDDGEWVSATLFDRMMAAAQEVTQDPSFGLVAGKSLALMKYGAITPVVLSTPSLRHMLADIHRFALLSVARAEVELVEGSHGAHLWVQPVVQGGLSGHFRMEQVATSAVQMLRFAGAGPTDIHEVSFPYALPAGQGPRYEASFGPRLHFERAACTVRFNPALLDRKLPTHDAVAYLAACTRADGLLAALQAGSNLADRVRPWLLSALPRLPTVLQTAAQLGLTERSYRRQLGMLGTSHAELAHGCQRLTAERLLAEGKMPLKQIAQAVGFSSVHSFHRAFRRWSGATPSDWRVHQGDSGKA